ncbi:unnamed protein product [Caenorhabditis auriculariae]|uniref:Uncharacterized protein n=1 Tax=Caenorhabditis auriculariae TaxID=2777116 RepID=A0A8S1HAW4_9PELO|nr:unnamed protein product [Caenorhabditis auriculariae]
MLLMYENGSFAYVTIFCATEVQVGLRSIKVDWKRESHSLPCISAQQSQNTVFRNGFFAPMEPLFPLVSSFLLRRKPAPVGMGAFLVLCSRLTISSPSCPFSSQQRNRPAASSPDTKDTDDGGGNLPESCVSGSGVCKVGKHGSTRQGRRFEKAHMIGRATKKRSRPPPPP